MVRLSTHLYVGEATGFREVSALKDEGAKGI